ncbi:MAG: hypothetical protein ABI723_13695 [Bacteroidia bacterium]
MNFYGAQMYKRIVSGKIDDEVMIKMDCGLLHLKGREAPVR